MGGPVGVASDLGRQNNGQNNSVDGGGFTENNTDKVPGLNSWHFDSITHNGSSRHVNTPACSDDGEPKGSSHGDVGNGEWVDAREDLHVVTSGIQNI